VPESELSTAMAKNIGTLAHIDPTFNCLVYSSSQIGKSIGLQNSLVQVLNFRISETEYFCQFQLILQAVGCRVFMCKGTNIFGHRCTPNVFAGNGQSTSVQS